MMHNMIDERAMGLLAKKIASSSGDIRVAFDIMKYCLEGSIPRVDSLMDEELQLEFTIEKEMVKPLKEVILKKLSINTELVLQTLDRLKPMNMKALLANLPR